MGKSEEWKKLISEMNQNNQEKHQVISTEIKCLDYILGGGIELGSKVQIVAESSTGKSTLALQIAKNFCRKNLNVLYVDTENSITKELIESTECTKYMANDNKTDGMIALLKESDFDTVNEKLDTLFKSGVFKLIIVDSLASMVSNSYLQLNSKDKIIPLTNNNTNYESRPLNLFINKYSNLANKYNVAIIYINQFRNKVDPKNGTILKEYGNKIVRYNSDIIIRLKKEKEGIWQDENGMFSNSKEQNNGILPTHVKVTFTLDKSNKMLSGTSVEGYLKYGYGIDIVFDETLNRIQNNDIQKSGKYYILPNDSNKYDGLINLVNHIIELTKESKLCNEDVVSSQSGKIHIEFVDDDTDDSLIYDEDGKLNVFFDLGDE